jgi:Tse2-like ADP-ribosyltransferase toxin
MAKTDVTLYRALLGDAAKLKVRDGVPDPGMLDPRWADSEYVDSRTGEKKISRADVRVVMGKSEFEVLDDGGGTSLHDVSGWFASREFIVPVGTKYSDEILLVKDAKKKTNPKGTVSGYHYQLTVRTRMTVLTFKGYLDNMARAAAALQVELAKVGK